MNSINTLTSSRKFLLTSILGVASLVLITILACVIYLVEAEEQIYLETNTTAWANSLAQASVGYLVDNRKDSQKRLKAKLKLLVTPEYINYIHIYAQKNNGKISYFTGFNKSIYYPSIPDKIAQIKKLSLLNHQENHVELVVEIIPINTR